MIGNKRGNQETTFNSTTGSCSQAPIFFPNQYFRDSRSMITIFLPCGPLRLRKVKFHIIDQEMDEVLLERLLLRSLGFDLGNHPANVRDIFDGQDMAGLIGSDVNTEENDGFVDRLSALSPCKGLLYNKLEADPLSHL